MDRCRRHASLMEAFLDERERVVLGIPRLRKRDDHFDRLFTKAEERVVANGVPPMFTLRPALRELQRRGDAAHVVVGLADAADQANAEIQAMLDQPDWATPDSVGWSGAFAVAALVSHADDVGDARRAAIARMRVALERGAVNPRRFAHVVDRDAAMHGRDQVYGTLFVPVDGVAQPVWPMPSEREVNEARQSIGVPSLNYDRIRYQEGAKPGPFLAPTTRQDAVVLATRLTNSYLRHGRFTRRVFT
jgi:hypothetical protein